MKQLLKKLLILKVGAGLVSTYLIQRKRNQAARIIEQSDFFNLVQRVRYHPDTRRSDGFYKIRYHFRKTLPNKRTVEAIVQDYRPVDGIAFRDSLEIIISNEDTIRVVKQGVRSKPLITSNVVPGIIKNRVFAMFELYTEVSAFELESAYDNLRMALNESS